MKSKSIRSTLTLSATLTRDKPPTGIDYDQYLKDLWLVSAGDDDKLKADQLMAQTDACDTQVFVCTVEEIPQFVDWLTKIYDEHKRNKGHR